MNRYRNVCLAAAIVLVSLLSARRSDGGPIFDPTAAFAAGFTSGTNPNGVWSYGTSSSLASAIDIDTQREAFPSQAGQTDAWFTPTGAVFSQYVGPTDFNDGNVIIPAGTLFFSPGGVDGYHYSDLIFTAPATADYAIAVTFTAVEHNIDSDVHILSGGASLFSGFFSAYGQTLIYSGNLSLNAGETIEFTAGPGTAPSVPLHAELTGFSGTIEQLGSAVPEPSSLVVFSVVGAVTGIGALVRRRRPRHGIRANSCHSWLPRLSQTKRPRRTRITEELCRRMTVEITRSRHMNHRRILCLASRFAIPGISHIRPLFAANFTLGLVLGFAQGVEAGTFVLPATTGDQTKLDLGFFSGNTLVTIDLTGVISLTGSSSLAWSTNPDGSVVGSVSAPYDYANPGATNYPTQFGGDGTNHFPGGGGNIADGNFAFAGALTTDTTDPGAIRLGDVVGTFSASPTRSEWFSIGFADTILTPVGGSHLYVAVLDTYYPNNTGSYNGTFSTAAVPEPTSLLVFGVAGVVTGIGALVRRRRDGKQARGDRPT